MMNELDAEDGGGFLRGDGAFVAQEALQLLARVQGHDHVVAHLQLLQFLQHHLVPTEGGRKTKPLRVGWG